MASIVDVSKDKFSRNDQSKPAIISTNSFHFCFSHVTKNRDHNFSYFNDKTSKNSAYLSLVDLISETSKIDFIESRRRGKDNHGGCEAIRYEEFSKDIAKTTELKNSISPDTKLFVFRFYQQKYRAVFYRNAEENGVLLHLIGFDFDFSLYDHGK